MKRFFLILKIFIFPINCFNQDIDLQDDTVFYKSTYNEVHFYNKINHEELEPSFYFNNNLITTNIKDQRQKIRIHKIDKIENDKSHKWTRYLAKDNSGTYLYLTIAYDKSTKINVITLDYGTTLFYFEVEKYSIPKKDCNILDNILELGHLHDGYNGAEYTNEQVDNFLNQFGNSKIIKSFILNEFLYNYDNMSYRKTIKN